MVKTVETGASKSLYRLRILWIHRLKLFHLKSWSQIFLLDLGGFLEFFGIFDNNKYCDGGASNYLTDELIDEDEEWAIARRRGGVGKTRVGAASLGAKPPAGPDSQNPPRHAEPTQQNGKTFSAKSRAQNSTF